MRKSEDMKKYAIGYVLSGLFLACAVGCSSSPKSTSGGAASGSGGSAQSVSNRTPTPNDVAPGNQIQISCPDDPNLNGKYRIEFDGELKLPYEITVKAQDMTLSELNSRIVESYRPFFKSTPSIKVTFVERVLWVQVNGLVNKPGRFLVKPSTSLDEILGFAGGLQTSSENKVAEAQPRYVKIEQPSASSVVIRLGDYYGGDRSRVPKWRGGDQIFLQSAADDGALAISDTATVDVHMMGEVRTPGDYGFRSGADFFHYLVKAGGPTDRANLGKIEVIRGPNLRKTSMTFDLDDTDEVPALQPGDMVIVHAKKEPSNLVSIILSFLSTVLLAFAVF